MDEDQYPKFPHLENLDRVPQVLEAETLYITEKLHGFNARFGRTAEGAFWVGTRNQLVTDDAQGFTTWARQFEDTVSPGVTIYGEWFGKGVQKGVDYGPEKRFRAFAVRVGADLAHPDDAAAYVANLGIEWVPTIHGGPHPGMESLEAWRRADTALGNGPGEGIVIVPWPPVFDQYGHQVIAKFKAPTFAETAHARREQPTPADLATVVAFAEEYATDERMSHVLDQLAEQGIDGMDRRNTGALLRAFYEDVVREGRDHHDRLSEEDQKMVGKVLNGFVKRLVEARGLAAAA